MDTVPRLRKTTFPTEVLTRYFVSGFGRGTLSEAITAERSLRLWEPIIAVSNTKEIAMLTRAFHALDRHRYDFPTVGSVRAMQQVDLVMRMSLGRIGHRVIEESIKRS